MMNILSKPPEQVEINGKFYDINYDFKVWIEISDLLSELDLTDEEGINNIIVITKICDLAFGEILKEPMQDIFYSVIQFLRGYPKVENGHTQTEDDNGDKLYSFKHDINYIILAIRNQTGIDLSYRHQGNFHWWLFLLEFQSLEDRHYISRVMGYRAYKGNDKDYLQLKNTYALPKEYTRSEQKIIEKMDSVFYNS